MLRKRILDAIDDPEYRNPHNWPDVHVEAEESAQYGRDKQLILDWYDNENVREIAEEYHVTTSRIYRLVHKCLRQDRAGQIRGFAGLRRYNNGHRAYERSSRSRKGYAGRMELFLREHEDIRRGFEAAFHNAFASGGEYGGVMLKNNVLNWFDQLCATHGIRQDQYPRCLKTKGRAGLNRALRRLEEQRTTDELRKREGREAHNNFMGSEARDESRLCIYPYREVEVDAHYMDLMMVVHVITPEGVVRPELIGRCWLYAAIDVASRAILGYHFSLNEKVTREDFLQCIMNTLRPWKPKQLSIPGLYYPAGAGLPSGVVEGCGWRKYSLIRLDNDRIHLSRATCKKLMDTIGCAVHLGKPRVPLGRPFIERFFGTLEKHGWHQLPATTGTDPSDTRRRNPGKIAKKHCIALDEIKQVLDVLIAAHDATRTSAAPLYHTSPLHYLENFRLTEPLLANAVPTALRQRLPLLCDIVRCTIRGNRKEFRQPYVRWENAFYKSNAMRSAWSLINQEIDLSIYVEDVSTVSATLASNGASLGMLHAQPPWHRPHSFRTRKRITQHPCRVDFEGSADAVLTYQRYQAERMAHSSKAAKEVVRMAHDDHAVPGSVENPIAIEDYFARQPDFKPSGDDWIDL